MGYDDKKEFICTCCGKPVMLTKFASAKTARCDDCKKAGKNPDQSIVNNIVQQTSHHKQPTGGETKECACIVCGQMVTVTKFASAKTVKRDNCKGIRTDESAPSGLKIDLSRIDKSKIIKLEELYVIPSVIANHKLREMKCPKCGTLMRIIKIMDASPETGLVISYQCTECYLMMSISEQATCLMKPAKECTLFNYRGEQLVSLISSVADTRIRNSMEYMHKLLVDNGIQIDGTQIPSYLNDYERINGRIKQDPVGFIRQPITDDIESEEIDDETEDFDGDEEVIEDENE